MTFLGKGTENERERESERKRRREACELFGRTMPGECMRSVPGSIVCSVQCILRRLFVVPVRWLPHWRYLASSAEHAGFLLVGNRHSTVAFAPGRPPAESAFVRKDTLNLFDGQPALVSDSTSHQGDKR